LLWYNPYLRDREIIDILRDRRRPSTTACPLPSLLGNGDKCIEIVYGEKIIF
jgi:hypothetical protein